jgi:hypothetical protein
MGWVDWSEEAERRISRGDEGDGYRKANATIIIRAVDGIGIDSGTVREADGVRVVYNVSSAHLPQILASGYQNCYHRADRRTIGTLQQVPRRRRDVDRAIATAISPSADHEDIHYGAVELNGVGMHYYGDVCIVLKSAEFSAETVVLSRNSYDLTRSPMADIVAKDGAMVETLVKSIVGTRRDVASKMVEAAQWSRQQKPVFTTATDEDNDGRTCHTWNDRSCRTGKCKREHRYTETVTHDR